MGNRIAKTVSGRTSYFIYDTAHKLIAEADETGSITTQYLYIDHRPYAIMKAEGASQARTLYAIHADHRGLPLAATDSRQKIVWQGDFDAFGNVRAAKVHAAANDDTFSAISTAPAANDRKFQINLRLAGQYADNETGLYYNVHRYYDPTEGRYITPDPIGLAGGGDGYAYVNSNPLGAIDPLGLFEIPGPPTLGPNFFSSQSAYSGPVPFKDGGHGDIVHIAFAQYQAEAGEMRFSQTIIDQIIKNNYQSDANSAGCISLLGAVNGGGQCNPNNHFDNPNDGPIYASNINPGEVDIFSKRTASYKDGKNDFWIADAVTQLANNRALYSNVGMGGGNGDISRILGAFGQNSHALADFYAHSNWVDASSRGGEVKTQYKDNWYSTTKKIECGWVPPGLNQTRLWDEGTDIINYGYIYTGTVQLGGTANKVCGQHPSGDISCTEDKTTHGYWNKDHDGLAPGEIEYASTERVGFIKKDMYYWEVQTYDGKSPAPSKDLKALGVNALVYGQHWYADGGKARSDLKIGDRIYVAVPITNRHRMAFYLAIEDTKREIQKLYDAAEGKMVGGYTLQEVFKMDKSLDKSQLDDAGIQYETLFSKK